MVLQVEACKNRSITHPWYVPLQTDDPRHHDEPPIGPSPMSWLRYFFPQDFDLREGQSKRDDTFYQFFDVIEQPYVEDASVPPPAWAPNAYFQLSFTQLHMTPGVDLSTRVPAVRTSARGPDREAASSVNTRPDRPVSRAAKAVDS
jgi:hypothetical protein